MSYDAASFRAGLALGRLLWRPPTKSGGIDTGLGWAADREWLRYDSGIVATAEHSVRTPYVKSNNGWAIGAYVINGTTPGFGSDWIGIFLISSVADYSVFTLNTESGWATPAVKTFSYFGVTWYGYCFNQNATWGGGTALNTQFPVFDATGYITGYPSWGTVPPDDIYLAIMRAAGVRRI